MTTQCCTTAQTVCKKSELAFSHAKNNGKFGLSTLTYNPGSYPVVFTEIGEDTNPTPAAAELMKNGMKAWLHQYFNRTVQAHGTVITINGKPSICCLVDFPVPVDVEDLIKQGFLIPRDNWNIQAAKEGECVNNLRFRFFNSDTESSDKGGCCAM
ncbi:hypothetical protein BJY04DRAFT_214780 [Aspergillus karnatakaensis]|uniref:uncharacterized protein n=1 Tax=Aspergillus karnatakaensis TaxID=1810916 RepID=UPI003CCCEB39